MGNELSTLTEEEKRILRHPQSGQASQFYWACRNGDVRRVRELVETIPYEDLNCLEPNGSTALHAAAHGGHVEIVRILLNEQGCRRDRPNCHGLTAYEEAQTEEIRQLFHRPSGTNRFCDDKEQESLDLFQVAKSEDPIPDEDFDKDGYLKGHGTSEDLNKVRKDQGTGKMLTQSTVGRVLHMNTGPLYVYRKYLEKQLRDLIPADHEEKAKSEMLVQRAFEEENPLFLLRLYTLETPFYRGLKMTTENLRPYQWSLKKNAAIETKTFCSTSLERKVAQSFAEASTSGDDKRKTLMIFHFPKRTEQAINLGKISDKEPCISEYEDEAEVLVFPETLFFVKQIDMDSSFTLIYLEHLFVRPSSFISGAKGLYDIIKEKRK
ncbi:unnamed protein product [Adineta ricciae]|uniref:Mono(ADP-ribosyl)transferase n=1 Tax=Adineta ricciae TaxID=249248 RepID=A0A815YCA8_ADIRI|nr:unnamed protein product [Adineta ricciae]